MSQLRYFCLHAHSGVQTHIEYMNNITGFMYCVFCIVYLRPVFCVPNVASVSGLSILDFPFGFNPLTFIQHIVECKSNCKQ